MPVYIIQAGMGVIGIGAAIISTYYTTIWLLEFLPLSFSLLLSGIMIGFSVSAFETVILFFTGQVTKNKYAKVSIATGFIFLWIIVSAFSIVSTIAGQYNKHVSNLRDKSKEVSSTAGADWNIIQEKESDLKARINEYRKQMKTYDKLSSEMESIESRTTNENTWNENQWRTRKSQENIERLSEELNKVRDEKRVLLNKNRETGVVLTDKSKAKDIPNFYGWLAGVLSMNEDLVQFFLSLFPAVFCDIVAPVGIALSLFLRNKYKKA
jgi:hypothetical protein